MDALDILTRELRESVLWLTLNRPKVHNAMNRALICATREAVLAASRDPSVRVIVFVGAGDKAFSAGADIREIAEYDSVQMAAYNRDWLDLFRAIERSPKPVIAGVKGWATGGGTELSLACDFVICSDTARFGLAEINIGVIPGAGAAVRLTRWVGRLKAKELLILGKLVSGQEAVELHLANKCVAQVDLLTTVSSLAEELASKAPLAVAAAKASVNVGAEAELDTAVEYELKEFLLLFESKDQREGMKAFLEKRLPKFQGR
ncbi:MAG: enoyl-CoA hydratase/isomerase family protein [Alphaproteobacteria bacterium]